jgi:hypothetical protein
MKLRAATLLEHISEIAAEAIDAISAQGYQVIGHFVELGRM